jgi:hypothetical protein
MFSRPSPDKHCHLCPQFSNSVEFHAGFALRPNVLLEYFSDAIIPYAYIKRFISDAREKLSNRSSFGEWSNMIFYKRSFVYQ